MKIRDSWEGCGMEYFTALEMKQVSMQLCKQTLLVDKMEAREPAAAEAAAAAAAAVAPYFLLQQLKIRWLELMEYKIPLYLI